MPKILPRKIMDINMFNMAIKYYKLDGLKIDPKNFLEWECFSEPGLNVHDCNIRARLPGGHECEYCNNTEGRICPVSCHFQNFCLAVFAWRIGIGGSDFNEAMNNNLYKTTANELFKKVIERISLNGEFIKLAETFNLVNSSSNGKGENVSSNNKEICMAPDTSELLTLTEVSKELDCTYANVYNHVKSGAMESVTQDGKVYVSRGALEAFKVRPKGKRGRKAKVVTSEEVTELE